LKTISYHFLFH